MEEQFIHHSQRWWQSIQEDRLITGDVRNDEGSQAEPSWLGQQKGNTLAETHEINLFKTDNASVLCSCSFYMVGCQQSGAAKVPVWVTPSGVTWVGATLSLCAHQSHSVPQLDTAHNRLRVEMRTGRDHSLITITGKTCRKSDLLLNKSELDNEK